MLNKILNTLKADPQFDDKIIPARLIGQYIKEHLDDKPSEMTAPYIKELVFPDRDKILADKRRVASEILFKKLDDALEKQRVDEIRDKSLTGISNIKGRQNDLDKKTDKIASDLSRKIDYFNKSVSIKQKELDDKISDFRNESAAILAENKERFLKTLEAKHERIESKLKGIVYTENLNDVKSEISSSINSIEDRRLERERRKLEEIKNMPKPNKPREIEKMQIEIEETGQVITLER